MSSSKKSQEKIPHVVLSRARLEAAVPDFTATLSVQGLEQRIVIYRDNEGIPHVRAETEHDAFFGQGFATAQDRLWQMDFDRLRGQGRVSALVGAAAVEADLQMLRFQLSRSLDDDLHGCPAETQLMLEAYAAGVNAFVAQTPALPIEYEITGHRPEPWRPVDSLLVYRVRHILMGNWDLKLYRARLTAHLGAERASALLPDYPAGSPLSISPGQNYTGPTVEALDALSRGLSHLTQFKEPFDQGSNNWVAGPSKTASGKPLMAGDPHRAAEAPNVYYQNHVACPQFDAIGFSFPGVPGFPHFGHNGHVAWSITHAMADYQDLFIEHYSGDTETMLTYQYCEESRPVITREHKLEVKGEAPRKILLYRTHHGPVIAGEPEDGVAISFRYTAQLPPNRTIEAVRDMLQAPDADALEEAMRNWVDPVNNLVYCDSAGNFGYRTRGRLPLRNRDNGWIPVPGWIAEHDWSGFVPFDEMPAVRNPKCGFALSANQRIVDETYPYFIGWDYAPGFRASRIQALLESMQGMTSRHMLEIQRDVLSLPALGYKQAFTTLRPKDPLAAEALALITEWDGVVAIDRPVCLLFHTFRFRLLQNLMRPLLGELAEEAFSGTNRGANAFLARIQAQIHEWIAVDDRRLLPEGQLWGDALSLALGESMRQMRDTYGNKFAETRWMDEHVCHPTHGLTAYMPEYAEWLNPPPIPMAGDNDTVQAAGFVAAQGFSAQLVSVARYIIDPSAWERSSWIVPGGSSGHPGSTHYTDQAGAYESRDTLPMRYDWDQIVDESVTTQTLKPEARPE